MLRMIPKTGLLILGLLWSSGFGKAQVLPNTSKEMVSIDGDHRFVNPGFLLHVTKPESGFGTGLAIQEKGEGTGAVGFWPWDAQGGVYENMRLETVPGTTRFFDLAELNVAPQATHLQIVGNHEYTDYLAYYYFKDRPSSRAYAPIDSKQGSRWRFFPGNWQVDFDGIAVVNPGGLSGRIELRQFNPDGDLIHSEILAEALPPFGKVTYLVGGPDGSSFEANQNTSFELVGDINFSVLGLRGNLAAEAGSALWINEVSILEKLDLSVDVFEVDKDTVAAGEQVTLRLRVAHYLSWDLDYYRAAGSDLELEVVSQTVEPDGTRVYVIGNITADTRFQLTAESREHRFFKTLTVQVETEKR